MRFGRKALVSASLVALSCSPAVEQTGPTDCEMVDVMLAEAGRLTGTVLMYTAERAEHAALYLLLEQSVADLNDPRLFEEARPGLDAQWAKVLYANQRLLAAQDSLRDVAGRGKEYVERCRESTDVAPEPSDKSSTRILLAE